MPIRTNKVLLTITLATLNESTYYTGLCHLITEMQKYNLINDRECDKLDRYITKHRPNKGKIYSWPIGNKPPRIKWLKQQIKLLS